MDRAAEPLPLPARAVVVFCGSREGADPAARAAAVALGAGLASRGMALIYGGGRVGLMGALADAALAGGGQVTGIIPDFLVGRELAHRGISRLVTTASLHERKEKLLDMADAVVALPGGFGTYDELIEAITWRLLGLHEKPIYICNVNGWAEPLRALFKATYSAGFCDSDAGEAWRFVEDIPALFALLEQAFIPRL